jgi:hypothetical protein
MLPFNSKELKAVVTLDNVMDGSKRVLKENCLVVQDFDYECTLKRNEQGKVYGTMEPVILSFKIRVNDPRHAVMFLMEMASNNVCCFSFLFNATYGPNERLRDFEDGMVMKGYIVGAEEQYSTETSDTGRFRQMQLDLKLLVSEVVYLGYEEDKNLHGVFIHKNNR